jgi:type IV pilus assembly protein PilN
MRITLNLATRPYADQGPALKRLRIGMAVLAVILAGIGFGLLHFHQSALRMAAQEDAVNKSIARIRQEQQGYQTQMQQPANARVLKQAGFLNGLFDEKSFSWTAAMEDLERVLPGGVQVTAIEPTRGKDGRITLRLRVAGERERTVEMVRNMEHSRRFILPRISVENAETSSQGSLQPVRQAAINGKVSFDILAEYNPATPDERKAEIAAHKHSREGSGSGSVALIPATHGPRRAYMAQPAPQRLPGPQNGTHPNRFQDPSVNRGGPPGPLPIRAPNPTQGGPQ